MTKNIDVVEPTEKMLGLMLFLTTRTGPIFLTPEQNKIAETCNPKWIAFGFGNAAQITPEGRAVAEKYGDLAHKNKPAVEVLPPVAQRMNERQARKRAQEILDTIVTRMNERGYPVEATNKSGHRPDYIPADTYGGWESQNLDKFADAPYFESNLASALIGGYHSKAAIMQLMIEIRRYSLNGKW